jgi:hypothetical protein
VVGNYDPQALGKIQRRRGGSRGVLDDGMSSGEVSDDAGSREIFDGKFW